MRKILATSISMAMANIYTAPTIHQALCHASDTLAFSKFSQFIKGCVITPSLQMGKLRLSEDLLMAHTTASW